MLSLTYKRKVPTPKWMLPNKSVSPYGHAYPVGRQDRHFYFRSFLLSRKASNAINKLPKDISNANTPIKTEMISNAVIYVTSSPMYFRFTNFISSGGYHPVMGTFHFVIVSFLIQIINLISK